MQQPNSFMLQKPWQRTWLHPCHPKGYIEKRQLKTDRRSYELIPTAKAVRLVEETYHDYFKTMSFLETRLGKRNLIHSSACLRLQMRFYWRKKVMSRILITGASGNVGKYVAAYALKNGQGITVAGTHTETLTEMFGNTAKIVYLDFTDPATFKPALENADRVFIIRPPHLGKPENLKPFCGSAERARKHPACQLLYLSLA